MDIVLKLKWKTFDMFSFAEKIKKSRNFVLNYSKFDYAFSEKLTRLLDKTVDFDYLVEICKAILVSPLGYVPKSSVKKAKLQIVQASFWEKKCGFI